MIEGATQEKLRKSIDAIANEDFSGKWQTDIYFDPERSIVWTFLNTGNSVPSDAWHGIDKHILKVLPGAIASSVHRYLLDNEDIILSILEGYEGQEWDGSNHKGSWTEDSMDQLALLHQEPTEIGFYWDAGEWFSPIERDLKESWKAGKTADAIIDEQGCGDDVDGMCDRGEAIEWLQSKIEEWAEESEED